MFAKKHHGLEKVGRIEMPNVRVLNFTAITKTRHTTFTVGWVGDSNFPQKNQPPWITGSHPLKFQWIPPNFYI